MFDLINQVDISPFFRYNFPKWPTEVDVGMRRFPKKETQQSVKQKTNDPCRISMRITIPGRYRRPQGCV
ncbi:hypothetical protein CLOSTASPAR_05211 [[Clostridium] asparagiforme DSM 15981]|uniref:Uncharacterized protein n=1 Tax=[Clostridium] asparagiforme DSM 15981 TaxID=518636 RepID=C0D7G4_9FIRM|nr:hypothetical protein CLOSTASPAR_05211 [[Clostridium] asparagiforme DSM 15981]